jgi:hypothetical protein
LSACACWPQASSSPAGLATTSTAEQTCCSEYTQLPRVS